MCFWFALHCEKVEECQYLFTLDNKIKDILKNIRDNPQAKFEID